jgi:hypothetical protein
MNENEDELQFRLARAEDEQPFLPPFLPADANWPQRWEAEGTLRDRYNIYIDCLSDGEEPKTYDQWLNS